jgi:Ca2+:H+ antiporter
MPKTRTVRVRGSAWGTEWFLAVSVLTCIVFFAVGDTIDARMSSWPFLVASLAWLFAVVLGSSFAVVRHADHLAEMLGEPYGTLILTLSVTVIEVTSISAVMLHGDANPTLARDTLFAVVMIIMNGMVGLSLLIGGWRHREQLHNLQGANVYLTATIPLIVLSLVLPNFTQTTAGPTLSFAQQIFLVLTSTGLYAIFLVMQTGRHAGYFATTGSNAGHAPAPPPSRRAVVRSALLLLAHLLPALFLAEKLALPVNYLIETLHAPVAVGGVILAILVATPEAIGAVRAAVANQLQRSVNIFLGSILSTIGLTVPAMILISEFTGQTIVLGVEHADLVMLLLTLAVSMVTLSSGRTNLVQGVVHLVLFAAYLLLIFQA